MPQTKKKDNSTEVFLANSGPLLESISQQLPPKLLEIPSRFNFIWHNIKFTGQLLQAGKYNLFSVTLVARLGHIPFSSENKDHRRKLLANFTPRFIAGDYILSKNSQIEETLRTDFTGPVNARRLMEVITYILLDQREALKSAQTEIAG